MAKVFAGVTIAVVILFSALLGFAYLNKMQTEQIKLVIAMVPQQSPSHLLKIWTPFIENLENKTGVSLTLKMYHNIAEFEAGVENNEVDIAYMNPYHYTKYSKTGYSAVAKAKNKRIKGILVAKSDFEINDKNIKLVSFPSPNAFAATLITRNYLDSLGIQYSASYTGSHDNTYDSVARDLSNIGGGVVRTLKLYQSEYNKNLKILWESPGYTPHAFALNTNTIQDSVLFEKLKTGIVNTPASLVEVAGMKQGIEQAFDSDWDDIRALKIY